MQHQINEVQGKLDEANRTLNDFDAAKKKLSIENSDLLRQLEEAESQVSQLSKIKISLTTQLEDTKRLADEEARVNFIDNCTYLYIALKKVINEKNVMLIRNVQHFWANSAIWSTT